MKNIYLIVLASLMIMSPGFASEQKLTAKEATQIAKEAYVYGFPLALNYKTMYSYSINKKSPEYKGDFNQLGCSARVYTRCYYAKFRYALLYGMDRFER